MNVLANVGHLEQRYIMEAQGHLWIDWLFPVLFPISNEVIIHYMFMNHFFLLFFIKHSATFWNYKKKKLKIKNQLKS